MKKIETNILILGAGWSGLIAADLLNKAGERSVVILEKELEVGGLARTFNFNNFRFDIGGHRIYFKERANINYLKGIVCDRELLVLKTKSKLFFNNKYINYPITPISVLGIKKLDLFKATIDQLRLRRNFDKSVFEGWAKTNYGETLFNIFFKDYTEKVWGRRCDEISSVWAEKRIGINAWANFFENFLNIGDFPKDRSRIFWYPRDGIGYLVDSLVERTKNFCQIYKNVQLNQAVNHKRMLSSISFISNGSSFEVSFKRIISTIPVVELLKILPDNQNTKNRQIEESIKYRSLILVNLIFKKRLISKWHWCYYPSKNVVFSRVYEPKFWSEEMAGDTESTMICAEIFCDYADQYWLMDKSALVDLVKRDLIKVGLIDIFNNPLDVCIDKYRYAYPLLYSNFDKYLNEAIGKISNFNNLVLAGRSGTHSYLDMEECLNDVRNKIELL